MKERLLRNAGRTTIATRMRLLYYLAPRDPLRWPGTPATGEHIVAFPAKPVRKLIPQDYAGEYRTNSDDPVGGGNREYGLYCPAPLLHAFFHHLRDLLHDDMLFRPR